MANSNSARKRARQNVKQRAHNASRRSTLRTYVKKIIKAIETRDRSAAEAAFRDAQPVIDRMAGQGIIHRNKAARHKERLSARIRALQ
ncbi:MAG: 30S ribosomal protein S20 [Gammaproteobacteria bacterium]|nr:30S ribosomal protein S20 [Gammaproteobacteria bacterium]